MSVGLSDELAPLGTFPLLNDNYLKGGYQTVADVTARNAIALASRKAGMLVYTTATAELWLLYPGITDGSWTLCDAIVPLGGTTAARPATPAEYTNYWDTSLSKAIWYVGGVWRDATGSVV